MIKGIEMTLGDGEKYVIAPLTLGTLEDLQEEISAVGGGLDGATIKTMIDVAKASLNRNYPEITREQVRGLLDVENMTEVFEACMDVSGLKRKSVEAEQGEAKAAAPKPRRR